MTRCNTCLRECAPVMHEIHAEGRMAICEECADNNPITRMILSQPPREPVHPVGACAKCFHPIYETACRYCGEPFAAQGAKPEGGVKEQP